MLIKNKLLLALAVVSLQSMARESVDLSSLGWNITLDTQAQWNSDELYVSPVNIAALPVHQPTGGWQLLDAPQKRNVQLPATVEGELWGWNGQTYGVTGNYVGVSWFNTSVDVPANWTGKRITLQFDAVRFRAEVFVNHQLAGYDSSTVPLSLSTSPHTSSWVRRTMSPSASPTLTATSTGKTRSAMRGATISPIPRMVLAASRGVCICVPPTERTSTTCLSRTPLSPLS